MDVPYLDNAATTAVDPRVVQAMLGMLGPEATFGNPASSTHVHGSAAREAVAKARAQLAALLNADPREIVFTSGATEANNLALKGVAARHPGGHIVTSAIEHRAVLDPCTQLQRQGHEITYVPPLADGRVAPEVVQNAIRPETCLVSVMHANNETGVINDIAAIAAYCREQGVIVHTDAAQTLGKLALDMQTLPVDLVSVCAHKMNGPKGVGALYIRRRPGLRLAAQIHGGNQEGGVRSGTLPGHQLVGFGTACAIAADEKAADNARIRALRDQLEQALSARIQGLQINGTAERLPGHLNVAIPGSRSELLLAALAPQLAIATGSACTSALREPSHVLKAMGLPDELAYASVRFSLGRLTHGGDIDTAIQRFTSVVHRLQDSP